MSAPRIAPAPRHPAPGAVGDLEFLRRAEVRDVLAWLRLLADPQDAAAVVRALSRPPVELCQADLARVIALARRRKLDLVSGLSAASESPQVPPESRERIRRFALLHEDVTAHARALEPEELLATLIERVGECGRPLLAQADAAAQRASLEALQRLAASFLQANPGASVARLATYLTTFVPQWERERGEFALLPLASDAGEADDAPPAVELEAALARLREEVLSSVARIGGRLGELRLDTELDISHGVARYLELLKLSALLQRPAGQSLPEALADINARLLGAATSLQREILLTSPLDEALLATDADERALALALAPRGEPSLGPFLPRRGVGLALSASDIQTYRSCPLRYKFARVLRIPTEQTLNQRFGIVVHQVLERFHSEGGSTLAQMLELLDAGWRRAGLGAGPGELELLQKARSALASYHGRLRDQRSEPVWFERAFDFRLGPHHLRGRVDRVDRVAAAPGERYELIDYKTSRPKSAEQLKDDVQLSLYALAAREAWQLDSPQQAYYYVLDDLKVPVPRSARDAESVKDVVLEAGEGILAQAFEPTPSEAVCSLCEYRIVCPAAEA